MEKCCVCWKTWFSQLKANQERSLKKVENSKQIPLRWTHIALSKGKWWKQVVWNQNMASRSPAPRTKAPAQAFLVHFWQLLEEQSVPCLMQLNSQEFVNDSCPSWRGPNRCEEHYCLADALSSTGREKPYSQYRKGRDTSTPLSPVLLPWETMAKDQIFYKSTCLKSSSE